MARQIAVFVDHRPGSLAEVTEVLLKGGINIESIMAEGSTEFGLVRLQVSQPREAERILKEEGFQFRSGDVIVVRMENRPGALHERLRQLAEAGISVDFLFGTTGGDLAEMVLHVHDTARARQVLGLDAA